MIEVYRCVSEISFSLEVNGHEKRISFGPMTGGRSQFRTSEHKVQEGIEKLDQPGGIIHVTNIIKKDGDDEDEGSPKVDGPLNTIRRGHGEEMDEKLPDGKEGEKMLNKDEFDGEKDIQKDVTSFAEAKGYLIAKGCGKAIRGKGSMLIYIQEFGVKFPNLK